MANKTSAFRESAKKIGIYQPRSVDEANEMLNELETRSQGIADYLNSDKESSAQERIKYQDQITGARRQLETLSNQYKTDLSQSQQWYDEANTAMQDRKNAYVQRVMATQAQNDWAEREDNRTTVQKAVDKLLGVDRTKVTGGKTDWGQLAKGTVAKGANQVNSSFWSGVGIFNDIGKRITDSKIGNWLFGDLADSANALATTTINGAIDTINSIFGTNYGGIKNGQSALDFLVSDAQAGKANAVAKYEANANTSRAAQVIDQFGTSTIAAIPMAIEAAILAPTQAMQAAQVTSSGLSYFAGLQNAKGAEAVGMMAREGLNKLFKNPQFWTSYLQAAGDGYESAKEDGMSQDDAAVYALTNGFFNAMVEVGGADEALGGIQNFPMRLRQAAASGNKSAVVDWFKDSVLGEAWEEVQQGVLERGIKSFFGQDVPLWSRDPTDDRAIFNPYTAGQEFLGGAVVGGVLGGGQLAVNNAAQSISDSRTFKGNAGALIEAAKKSTLEADNASIAQIENAIAARKGNAMTVGEARALQEIASRTGNMHAYAQAVLQQEKQQRAAVQKENQQRDRVAQIAKGLMADAEGADAKINTANVTMDYDGRTAKVELVRSQDQNKVRLTFEDGSQKIMSIEEAAKAGLDQNAKFAMSWMSQLFGKNGAAVYSQYDGEQELGKYATAMAAAIYLNEAQGVDVRKAAKAAKESGSNAMIANLSEAQLELAHSVGSKLYQENQADLQQKDTKRKAIVQQAQEAIKNQDPSVTKALGEVNAGLAEARQFLQETQASYQEKLGYLQDLEDSGMKDTEAYQNALQEANRLRGMIDSTQKAITALETERKSLQAKQPIKRKKGTVSFDGATDGKKTYEGVDPSKLNKKQTAVVEMVKKLADVLDIDFVIFQGDAGTGGFYKGGNAVYLNINSGMGVGDFNNVIAAGSLSHELTHWLKTYAPKEYAALKDYIVNDIIEKKGADEFERLVQQQRNWEKGRELTHEEAIDEVVANACQTMLRDSNAITELAQQNRTLAEKIRDFIQDLIDRIKAAFEDVDIKNDAAIYDAARAIEGEYEDILKLWDEALKVAAETGSAVRSMEAETEAMPAAAQNVQNMQWENQTLQEHEVLTAVYDVLDHADDGDDNLVKVGRMPKFVRVLTGIDGDFYVYRDHLYEDIKTHEEAVKEGRARRRGNFHGIGTEKVIQAIMSLENPAMTIDDSRGRGNPEAVMVLPVPGNDGSPLIAALGFYSNQPINGKLEKKPHVVLSIYEKTEDATARGKQRSGLYDFVSDAAKEGRIISMDKNLSAGLPVIAQHPELGNITTSSLKDNLAQFRKSVNDFRAENNINYQQWENAQKNAVDTFGTTTDFAEAGYIMPDGSMLRFSDDNHAGTRDYDHRAIGAAYGADVDLSKNHGFSEDGGRYLEQFVEDGGIRIEAGDLDLNMDSGIQLSSSKPLTKAQEQTIRDFIEWKQNREETYKPDEDSLYSGPLALHIDFGGDANIALDADPNNMKAWNRDFLVYEGGQINANRIIEDIRHYYRTGEIRQPSETAKYHSTQFQAWNEQTEQVGASIDQPSESAYPDTLQFSQWSWDVSDYVQKRDDAAKALAEALGVSKKKALAYIDSINGVAKAIADDRTRLDYEASEGVSALVGNTEYGGSIDFSTICKKRRLLTGTFTAIQKALPNTALTAEEVLTIRRMMADKGDEVSCGLCYVEGSRAKMGIYAKQFLEQYAKTNPDYLPNMAEINTPEGIEQIRKQHPDVYDAYVKFMNGLAQRKPKLYQMATEYMGEVLDKFLGKKDQVDKYNHNGGLRLQSFSDFEIIHLIDNMQVIMDMARVGLNGQAYTKVPEFAWAMGKTGLKINLSLISKGVDANGRLILDEKEGMKRADAEALRNAYSDNVGTILVVFNDEQLRAAMADDFIDFIIPFHRSQWNSQQYALMGLPEGAKDYTPWQNESYIEPVLNKNGKPTRPSNYMPNNYWNFRKTGKQNAEAYLKMCAENNRKPKFSNLLVDNGDGSYSLQPDGSTDGYWKLLIDFKMYNNDGKGVPQKPVKPIFNEGSENDPRTVLGMLKDYKGGHQTFPVDQEVVDKFVSDYKAGHPDQTQFQTWQNPDQISLDEWMNGGVKVDNSLHPRIRSLLNRAAATEQKVKDYFSQIPEDSEYYLDPEEIDDMMEVDPFGSAYDGYMYNAEQIVQNLSDLSKEQYGKAKIQTYELMDELLGYMSTLRSAEWKEELLTGNKTFTEWYNQKHPSLYYPGYVPGDLANDIRAIQKEKVYLKDLIESGRLSREELEQAQRLYQYTQAPFSAGTTYYQQWDNRNDDTQYEAEGRDIAYAMIQAENNALKDAVTGLNDLIRKQNTTIGKLQKRLKLTKDPGVRLEDARKLANQLTKKHGSVVDKNRLADELKALGDYVLQSKKIDQDELKQRARLIAAEIVENAETTSDLGGEAETYRNIVADMRGKKLTIDKDFLGELSTDDGYDAFRKKNFGNFTLAKRETGEARDGYATVGSFYSEMQQSWGKAYFPDVANEGEQIQVIASFFDLAKPETVNPYAQYLGEATEELANEIVFDALDGVMRQIPPTTADRWKAKTDEARAKAKAAEKSEKQAGERTAAQLEDLSLQLDAAQSREKTMLESIRELERQGELSEKEAQDMAATIYDLSLKLDAAKSRYTTMRKEAAYRAEQIRAEGRARQAQIRAEEKAKASAKVKAVADRYKDMAQRAKERRAENAGATKYRKKIQQQAKKLSDWLMKNSDKEHIPEALKAPLLEFLTSIDFTSKRALNGGEETQADVKFGARLLKLQQMLANQQSYINGDGTVQEDLGGYVDISPDMLQFLRDMAQQVTDSMNTGTDFTINRMTAAQLKDLSNLLASLTTSIRNMNALMANARYANVREAASQDIDYEQSLGKAKDQEGSKLSRFLKWKQAIPYYAFKRYGNGGRSIFDGLSRGWEKLAFHAQEIIDFTENLYTDQEVNEWKKDIHNITLQDGSEIRMTTAQIMELAMLLNREQARKHLNAGGMRIGNIEYKKGVSQRTITDTTHYHLSAQDINTLMGLLTQRQMDVADAMQKYMANKGAEWGNEISMRRFGYNFYTEGENYYPIKTDATDRPMADTEAQQNSMFRLLNLSSSKSLNPKASNALVVEDIFDTFADHMADQAKLNALGLPILDAIKWFNFKERIDRPDGTYDTRTLQAAMEQAYGQEALKYFRTLIKDVNGVTESGDRGTEIFSKMMSNYKVAAVGANLRVALLQPTAYVRAQTILTPRNLLRAFAYKNGYKEAMKYSGTAVWKSLGYYDTNISRNMRQQIQHDETFKDKVQEKSMALAEKMDAVTWGRLWVACKLQAQDMFPNLSGDPLMQETANLFRNVVYSSQVMDGTLTRSELMRGKTEKTKALTAFMAEPTLSYNVLLDAYSEYTNDVRQHGNQGAWQRNKDKLFNAFVVYVSSATVSAIAESIADAVRDDDDYESFLEKFLQALFGEGKGLKRVLDGNLVQDLLISNKIPFAKDIVNKLIGFGNSADMSTESIGALINAIQIWIETWQLAHGTLDKATGTTYYGRMTPWGKIYKSLQALSQMTGFAASAALRDVFAIWNTTFGDVLHMKVKTYDAGAKKNIFQALDDGALDYEEAVNLLVSEGIYEDADKAEDELQKHGAQMPEISLLLKYIGDGNDKAAQKVLELLNGKNYSPAKRAFSVRNGVEELYANSNMSYDRAMTALVNYAGMSTADASKRLDYAKLMNEHFDEINTSGDSELQQGELGEYLSAAESRGDITHEKAVGIWEGHNVGELTNTWKTTYEQWLKKSKKEVAASVAAPDGLFKPMALPDKIASYDQFSKNVKLHSDKKETAYQLWESTVKPLGIDLDTYTKYINASDTDGNGSIKQDELGVTLTNAIQKGELSGNQADAIWYTIWNGGRSKTYAKWAASHITKGEEYSSNLDYWNDLNDNPDRYNVGDTTVSRQEYEQEYISRGLAIPRTGGTYDLQPWYPDLMGKWGSVLDELGISANDVWENGMNVTLDQLDSTGITPEEFKQEIEQRRQDKWWIDLGFEEAPTYAVEELYYGWQENPDYPGETFEEYMNRPENWQWMQQIAQDESEYAGGEWDRFTGSGPRSYSGTGTKAQRRGEALYVNRVIKDRRKQRK